jgi:hypothetical protein
MVVGKQAVQTSAETIQKALSSHELDRPREYL